MTFSFRPAKRENTPLIVGIAGPTKSGKTYSAHRLAAGIAQGGPVVMINAEGAKGHQYADKFAYLAADISAPYRPERYTEALKAALALNPRPAVIIFDSLSHMHDGPGGVLDYHEDELDRMVGQDYKARERATFAAWVKPKAAENEFIYTLDAPCHFIFCLRAKEKIKIVKGKPPIDLGWQPIVGDRVAFETSFTLMLPPHSKGVPDMGLSEMREPFDSMIPVGRPLSEETGMALALWAAGGLTEPDQGSDGHLSGSSDRPREVGVSRESPPAASLNPSPGSVSPWADLKSRCDMYGITEAALDYASVGLFGGSGKKRAELTQEDCDRIWEEGLGQKKIERETVAA